MLAETLAVGLGVGALWVGGEQFVLGTSRLAERTRLPAILVGMVVAGFGTSAPELAVSLLAQRAGEGEVALGNLVGSNVANVLLVLPAAALVAPWAANRELPRREIPAVLAGTGLLAALAADGWVGRAEAAALAATFVALMSWLAVSALRGRSRPLLEAEIRDLVGEAPSRAGLVRESVRALGALAVVLVSADRLVWGAGGIARDLGVSEATIGLTVVAVGTSLPELVTGIVAARRREPELLLGNVLGSNLFNALLIAGVAGLVRPLSLPAGARSVGLVGVGLSALVLLAFLHPRYRLGRAQAAAWLAAYGAFVVLLYRS